MKRALIVLCLTLLAGCAQLKARTDPNSDVGKATKPTASGFLDMPFLTTLSEEEARQTMADSQMTGTVKVEYTECNDKSIPPGHVCNTVPLGGAQTTTTSDITLFVVPK